MLTWNIVSVPLICLGCRRRDGDVWDLHTIEREGATLRCGHCGQKYPVVDDIPIVVPDLAEHLARDGWAIAAHDLEPAAEALLALAGPDDAPFARAAETTSIYMDAHWGDRADPRPDGPGGGFGLAALLAKIAARAAAPVERAVELGAGHGRAAAELARGARVTLALDRSMAPLRRGRRLLRGETVRYLRRTAGRHYREVTVLGISASVSWLCADALDPPLPPGSFERVAALNVLDVVHDPGRLLDVAALLCAPGGEILLCSPYNWQSGHVGEAHRLGDADPAAAVRARLGAAGFAIEDEDELSWTLRRDARSAVVYRTHYLRARKA